MAVKAAKRTVKKPTKTAAGNKLVSKKARSTSLAPDVFAEYVQKRAYYIWQESGQPTGKDYEIWLQAEKDVTALYKK